MHVIVVECRGRGYGLPRVNMHLFCIIIFWRGLCSALLRGLCCLLQYLQEHCFPAAGQCRTPALVQGAAAGWSCLLHHSHTHNHHTFYKNSQHFTSLLLWLLINYINLEVFTSHFAFLALWMLQKLCKILTLWFSILLSVSPCSALRYDSRAAAAAGPVTGSTSSSQLYKTLLENTTLQWPTLLSFKTRCTLYTQLFNISNIFRWMIELMNGFVYLWYFNILWVHIRILYNGGCCT